jgi:hypothetical protein
MTASSEQVLVAASASEATSAANVAVKPTGAQLLAAFPPRPLAASWAATEASRFEVLARVLAPPFTLDNRASQQTRRVGVLAVLSWLQTHPGTAGSNAGGPAARKTGPTGEMRSPSQLPVGAGPAQRRAGSWRT